MSPVVEHGDGYISVVNHHREAPWLDVSDALRASPGATALKVAQEIDTQTRDVLLALNRMSESGLAERTIANDAAGDPLAARWTRTAVA